jgi:hypothetical protein
VAKPRETHMNQMTPKRKSNFGLVLDSLTLNTNF